MLVLCTLYNQPMRPNAIRIFHQFYSSYRNEPTTFCNAFAPSKPVAFFFRLKQSSYASTHFSRKRRRAGLHDIKKRIKGKSPNNTHTQTHTHTHPYSDTCTPPVSRVTIALETPLHNTTTAEPNTLNYWGGGQPRRIAVIDSFVGRHYRRRARQTKANSSG